MEKMNDEEKRSRGVKEGTYKHHAKWIQHMRKCKSPDPRHRAVRFGRGVRWREETVCGEMKKHEI